MTKRVSVLFKYHSKSTYANLHSKISFLVHGQVQGVGFRYFTRKRASFLTLTGWVRNTPTNKASPLPFQEVVQCPPPFDTFIQVEGEAQGSSEHIETFISELNKGPSHSSVSKVETSDMDVVDGEKGFGVRH